MMKMSETGELAKRVKTILEKFPPVSTLKSCSSMNESLASMLMWIDEAKADIFEAMRKDGVLESRKGKGCPETYKKLVKWFGTHEK
jgi:hypothetical protein